MLAFHGFSPLRLLARSPLGGTRRARHPAAVLLAALAVFSLGASAGTITSVASRAALAANDMTQWGTSADDSAVVASPYGRTSTGGVAVSAVLGTGFGIFVEGAGTWTSNLAAGDVLLSTFNPVSGDEGGPFTISFGSAVRGVGFNIAHLGGVDFAGTLAFYGTGDALFGSITVDGISDFSSDGSAVFLGGLSSLRDIVRVDVSVDLQNGTRGFAINQMSLLTTAPDGPPVTVPEPASLSLVALALAGGLLAGRGRRGCSAVAA